MREEQEIKDLREEMADRFGKITEPVENLLKVTLIRLYAKKMGVKSVTERNLRVEIVFSDWELVNAQGIIDLSRVLGGDFKFIESSQRIFVTFKTKTNFLERILKVLKILIRR